MNEIKKKKTKQMESKKYYLPRDHFGLGIAVELNKRNDFNQYKVARNEEEIAINLNHND